MPTTIYTSGSGPWLQSETQQSFASGLLSISREYAVPRGSGIPRSLQKGSSFSAGNSIYQIFPEPTLSISTDSAFDRVNVTAYALSSGASEERRFLQMGILERKGKKKEEVMNVDGTPSGQFLPFTASNPLQVLFEVVFVRKTILATDNTIPQPTNPPRVISIGGQPITLVTIPEFENYGPWPVHYSWNLTNVSQNNFGSVKEIEATYSITRARSVLLDTGSGGLLDGGDTDAWAL